MPDPTTTPLQQGLDSPMLGGRDVDSADEEAETGNNNDWSAGVAFALQAQDSLLLWPNDTDSILSITTQALVTQCESLMTRLASVDNNNETLLEQHWAVVPESEQPQPMRDSRHFHMEHSVNHRARRRVLSLVLVSLLCGLVLECCINHGSLGRLAFPTHNHNHKSSRKEDDDETTMRQTLVHWHGFLMVLAFLFMNLAQVSFPWRQSLSMGRSETSLLARFVLLETFLWILAVVGGAVGMLALVGAWYLNDNNDHANRPIATMIPRGKDETSSNNNGGTGERHVPSFHAILGAGWCLLHVGPILGRRCLVVTRRRQSPPHPPLQRQAYPRLGGLAAYLAAAVTLLLGLQEQESLAGCSSSETYPSQPQATNDNLGEGISSTHDIHTYSNDETRHFSSCLSSHVLGVLLVGVTIGTCWALYGQEEEFGGSDSEERRLPAGGTGGGSPRIPATTRSDDRFPYFQGDDRLPYHYEFLLDQEEEYV